MGRVITPDCPVCMDKMRRMYWRPAKNYNPVGFLCIACKQVIWDE